MDPGLIAAVVLWFLGACHVGPLVWLDPEPPVNVRERLVCLGLIAAWPLLIVGALVGLAFRRF